MTLLKKYKTPKKLREYKREYMRKRRANPIINERIKELQRKGYIRRNGIEYQRKYIARMKEERFFHWRSRLFNQHYKTKYNEDDFKRLWNKQKSRCALTGRKLDKTAHIDHILPIKRGGNHKLNNLRWVCKEVNYMKRDLTDKEFINVIKAIMERLI